MIAVIAYLPNRSQSQPSSHAQAYSVAMWLAVFECLEVIGCLRWGSLSLDWTETEREEKPTDIH